MLDGLPDVLVFLDVWISLFLISGFHEESFSVVFRVVDVRFG